MNASEVILKTLWKTIFLILILLAIGVVATGLIMPKAMGDLTYKLGLNEISIEYTRMAYNNSGDISDLADLTDRTILVGDYESTNQCINNLIEHEQYSAFCDYQDSLHSFSYDIYINNQKVFALTKIGSINESINLAITRTTYYNEEFNNSIHYILMADSDIVLSSFQINLLDAHADNIYNELLLADSNTFINSIVSDMVALYDNAQIDNLIWEQRFIINS